MCCESTDGLSLTRVRRRRHGVHLHHHLLRGQLLLLLLVRRAVHDPSVGVDHHTARNGGHLHATWVRKAFVHNGRRKCSRKRVTGSIWAIGDDAYGDAVGGGNKGTRTPSL